MKETISKSNPKEDSTIKITPDQEKSTSIVQLSLGKCSSNNTVFNKEIDWNDLKAKLTKFPDHPILYNPYKLDKRNKNKMVQDETGEVIELSFEDAICQAIGQVKKKLPYFVGGHFREEKRNNKNLISRSLVTLDIDKHPEDIKSLEGKLDKELAAFEYIAYSTASHTAKRPSIRVVILLKEDITTKDYKEIVSNFINTLSFKNSIDSGASTTPSQAMYLPVHIEVTQQPDAETLYKYVPWSKENSEEQDGKAFDATKYMSKPNKPPKNVNDNNSIQVTEIDGTELLSCVNKSAKINKRKLNSTKVGRILELHSVSDLDWKGWIEVGMALHHYYEGQQEGLEIWNDWSALDDREGQYKKEEIIKAYATFKADVKTPVTMSTIEKRVASAEIDNMGDVVFKRTIGGHDFILTTHTLYKIVETTDEFGIKQKVPMRVSNYIELKGQGTNSNGQNCFVMRILDRYKNYKEIFVPLVAKSDILKQVMLDAGLTFNPTHFQKILVNYILADESRINIAVEYRLGWNSDTSCYNIMTQKGMQTFYRKKEADHLTNVLEFRMKSTEVLKNMGTLEEWQDNVAKYCSKNSNLMFSLFSAFAPIYITPLNRTGVILHFYGKSSIGKSVMLGASGSVWGNPGDGYIPWNGTSNGLENLGLQKNDALLCLDELTSLHGKHAIMTSPYLIIGGESKNRADSRGDGFGNRSTKTWKTLVISTGEETFQAKMAGIDEDIKGGQTVRFIDIPAFLSDELGAFEFLHDLKTPKELALKVYDSCAKYRGTAIEAFLKFNFVENNFDDMLGKVESMKELWLKQNMPEGATAQVGRVAEVYGIMAAAGEMVIESGVLPAKYGFVKGEAFRIVSIIFKRWLSALGDYTISAETKIVKDKLRQFFFKHHANDFYIREKHEFAPENKHYSTQNICVGINLSSSEGQGKQFSATDTREFYAFQDVLEREAFKGSNVKDCVKIMRDHGYIVVSEEKKDNGKFTRRSTHLVHYSRTNVSTRCYKLNLQALSINISENEQEDCEQKSNVIPVDFAN